MKAVRLFVAAGSLLFLCGDALRAEPVRPKQLQGKWVHELGPARFSISFTADGVEMESHTPLHDTTLSGKFTLNDGTLYGVFTHVTWATQISKGEVNDLLPFACRVEMQDGELQIKNFTLRGLSPEQEKQACGTYAKAPAASKQ